MRQIMIAGNWKMHGSLAFTRDMIQELSAKTMPSDRVNLLICPPMLYLTQAIEACKGTKIQIGAQNCAYIQSQGAYTGEVSVAMLSDVGCRYVIVGHSERRALFGETDQVVAEKTKVALACGLTPIICVGETLEQRESNQAKQVIAAQLDAVLEAVGVEGFSASVIAYEPVWAIGTGKTATPEQAQEIHAFIRQHLSASETGMAGKITILYGGSVKPDNASAIFSQPDVDGGLIGGASLNSDDFANIYAAAVAL